MLIKITKKQFSFFSQENPAQIMESILQFSHLYQSNMSAWNNLKCIKSKISYSSY